MINICNECPVADCIERKFEDGDQILAVHVAQFLSGIFVQTVRGTKGLTDERINEIDRDIRVSVGGDEKRLLEEAPDLVRAVYDCEEKISVLGNCALHSVTQKP